MDLGNYSTVDAEYIERKQSLYMIRLRPEVFRLRTRNYFLRIRILGLEANLITDPAGFCKLVQGSRIHIWNTGDKIFKHFLNEICGHNKKLNF